MRLWLGFFLIGAISALGGYFMLPKAAPELKTLPINHPSNPPFSFSASVSPSEASNADIIPFKISVPQDTLKDLQHRLEHARLPPPQVQAAHWDYGMNESFLRDLLAFWRDEFDWGKTEEELNRLPHFKTLIDGLEIHFVHVKAQAQAQAQVLPLILIHGWPGSFFEFHKVIEPLTKGEAGGPVFDLVIPSLPGYGFSEAPTISGLGLAETAAIYVKLMKRLGYGRYLAQGGDWGSFVSASMAQQDPEHCMGIHLNMFTVLGNPALAPLRFLLGAINPSLILAEKDEQEKLFPLSKTLTHMALSTGYAHEQATKPDTLGYSLADSPVGLAAWLAEKFHGWSHHHPDGSLRFSKQELVTNIMFYWLGGSAATSVRYYRETAVNSRASQESIFARVSVPAALADFPKDIQRFPGSWASFKFVNLVSVSKPEEGGHFAALEAPGALVEDIRRFAVLLRDPPKKE